MGGSEKQKKGVILKAAKELFLQYGYKKTSVDEIAERAAVGKGTVYLYFSTKEDLFVSVALDEARKLIRDISGRALQLNNPVQRLAGLIRFYPLEVYSLIRNHPHGGDFLSPGLSSKIMFENNECYDMEKEYIKLLAQILEEGSKEGFFSVADPERLAKHINFMVQAFLPPYCSHTDEAYLNSMLDDYLELLFKAIGV